MSECLKIKPKIEKYLKGKILDIGCGDTKICENAIGVDLRNTHACNFQMGSESDIYEIPDEISLNNADVIFSSHLIEHVESPYGLIWSAYLTLKKDGLIILYVPDGRYYDDISNPEHLHTFRYEIFMRWFTKAFKNEFEVIEYGPDWDKENHYSFYLVARKK